MTAQARRRAGVLINIALLVLAWLVAGASAFAGPQVPGTGAGAFRRLHDQIRGAAGGASRRRAAALGSVSPARGSLATLHTAITAPLPGTLGVCGDVDPVLSSVIQRWMINDCNNDYGPDEKFIGSVRLFIHSKQCLGYSQGANYSQAGGWTTGYLLIIPGSGRGVPTKVSSLKAPAYMRRPDPLPPAV